MSMAPAAVILADIGGTNARFAIWEGPKRAVVETYPVAEYATPVDAAKAFLAGPARGYRPSVAAFCAAGPVYDGVVHLTNAGWIVDAMAIRDGLGLRAARVVNDFEALAWSVTELGADDIRKVGGGSAEAGAPIAVIGPGTGFGMAVFNHGPHEDTVIVTEGGHATLPAENRREDAIIQVLRERFGHISIERALSGGGLVDLYDAINQLDGRHAPARTAAEIGVAAVAHSDETSRIALETFFGFLGSVAGNTALTVGARGGVYIGGGIVPRDVEFMAASLFRERFEAKGRMRRYVEPIPTIVITHHYPAFLGLARLARGDLI
jgi:glucokinase